MHGGQRPDTGMIPVVPRPAPPAFAFSQQLRQPAFWLYWGCTLATVSIVVLLAQPAKLHELAYIALEFIKAGGLQRLAFWNPPRAIWTDVQREDAAAEVARVSGRYLVAHWPPTPDEENDLVRSLKALGYAIAGGSLRIEGERK